MPTTTVTSKGQITIPVAVRRKLGLAAGSRVRFDELVDGTYALVAVSGSIRSLKGVVRARANPVSLEEMDAAIAAASVERSHR